MPHLSPMKWLSMYILMIFLTMLFMMKINFLMNFKPLNQNNYNKKMSTMKWKF